MKRYLAMLVVSLALMGACDRGDGIVDSTAPAPETPDESIVISNCAALEAAVLNFAAENDGAYPANVGADTTLAGNTMMDLLGEGALAENPFTGSPTAPLDGAAQNPGEVGYAPVCEGDWNVGYLITGYGTSSLVATLSNVGSPEEAKVLANCFIVRQAAERQYSDHPYSGYPFEIPSVGWPHLWLYPLIVNPYTGEAGMPVPRIAEAPGEAGYSFVRTIDGEVGYVVTGCGAEGIILALSNLDLSREEMIVASRCRTIQLAAEAWAQSHGSCYPTGMSCPEGVAYRPIQAGEWNVGYLVTGAADGTPVCELTNISSPEDAAVRLNCQLLRKAVEEFAALSLGRYPNDVDRDTTPGGETVVDLLPRSHLFLNPFTGVAAAPVNHSASDEGEIGYAAVSAAEASYPGDFEIAPGYVITGMCAGSRAVAVTNMRCDQIGAVTISHCRTLQLAVERFASLNGGVYPGDISCDMTPGGDTIVDLLPHGAFLLNRAILCYTEPVDGCAVLEGQVGYHPVCRNGVNVGCIITGVGCEAGTTVMVIVMEPPYVEAP